MQGKTNPVATEDQRSLEDIAMRIAQAPEVLRAKAQAKLLWMGVARNMYGAEALSMIDSAMDDYAFNYIMKAVNSDVNYPKVLRLFMPEHTWFGRKVPGARLAGDCPDFCYRIIPIEGGARYVVRGQQAATPPVDVTFTIVANTSTSRTIHTMEMRDVLLDQNGAFTITIDDQPANGRPNHLQSTRRARYLFIRMSPRTGRGRRPMH